MTILQASVPINQHQNFQTLSVYDRTLLKWDVNPICLGRLNHQDTYNIPSNKPLDYRACTDEETVTIYTNPVRTTYIINV